MTKLKSSKNKTIDFAVEEAQKFLQSCLTLDDDSYSLEEIIDHTIIGDALETLSLLPSNSVDLAIIDPPYNLSKNYHGNKFSQTTKGSYQVFTQNWLEKLIPSLKDTATLYVCCDWRSSLIIYEELEKHFHVHNRITWHREKGRGARKNWKNAMEDIWFATVSPQYIFNIDAVKIRKKVIAPYRNNGIPKDWQETAQGNYRDTHPANFWDDITIPYWSMAENTAHPTQKPEKLIAKLILASSDPGDVILDPFLGSGTSSVVAKKLGRHYIGIEQNELYCAWTQYRLEMADSHSYIQGYTDGVFWERNSLPAQKNSAKF